ncbi:hypothetical protein, partial [Priestia megaterium]|uniref:hypothetical protein n=1 Tax=Priestia megaterium TaxID=1404 RepID=UPI001C551FA9
MYQATAGAFPGAHAQWWTCPQQLNRPHQSQTAYVGSARQGMWWWLHGVGERLRRTDATAVRAGGKPPSLLSCPGGR